MIATASPVSDIEVDPSQDLELVARAGAVDLADSPRASKPPPPDRGDPLPDSVSTGGTAPIPTHS